MRIFVNYAQADTEIVEQVVEMLAEEGHSLALEDKLMPGDNWSEKLAAAIESADALLYAISPDSLTVDWCEWCYAKAVEIGKPVIPALLRESASLPPALTSFRYIDFANGFDPEDRIVLKNALNNLQRFVVPTDQKPPTPERPNGIPVQAVGSLNIGRATPLNITLLPDVLKVLPPPFEWLEVSAGDVTLPDAQESVSVKRFFVAQYAVTNAQYKVFVDDPKGYANESWWLFSPEATDWRQAHPDPAPEVTFDENDARLGLSWYDGLAYCRWLNVQTRPLKLALRALGQGPRMATISLPSEKQLQRASETADLDAVSGIVTWTMNQPGRASVSAEGDGERILRNGSERMSANPGDRSASFGLRLVCFLVS